MLNKQFIIKTVFSFISTFLTNFIIVISINHNLLNWLFQWRWYNRDTELYYTLTLYSLVEISTLFIISKLDIIKSNKTKDKQSYILFGIAFVISMMFYGWKRIAIIVNAVIFCIYSLYSEKIGKIVNLIKDKFIIERKKQAIYKEIINKFLEHNSNHEQQIKTENLCKKFLSSFYDQVGNKFFYHANQDENIIIMFRKLLINIDDLTKELASTKIDKYYHSSWSYRLQSFIYNFYKENEMNFDKLVQKMHNLKESEKGEINTIGFIFKDIKEFIENQQI